MAVRHEDSIRSRRQVDPLKPDTKNIKIVKERIKREESLLKVSHTNEVQKMIKKETSLLPKAKEEPKVKDIDISLDQTLVKPS